jgi:hypothetical protein
LSKRAAAAVGGLAALLVLGLAGVAAAALNEPVAISASAPESVEAGKPFQLEVAIEAEAGALNIAAAPLTLGVKLAPECGGSLGGTPGSPVLQETLPNPAAAAAYSQIVTGQVTASATGTDVVCAFLQDSQERQFATDTGAEVNVSAAGGGGVGGAGGGATTNRCTTVTKQLKAAKRNLKRLDHRIAKLKRKLHHTRGAHRKALARKLHKLESHKKKAQKRRKAAAKQVAKVCS